MNKQIAKKAVGFFTAITDLYEDEDKRRSLEIPKMKLCNAEITEDFTAMIYAMREFYMELTDKRIDPVDFTHICNKLIVQDLVDSAEEGEKK